MAHGPTIRFWWRSGFGCETNFPEHGARSQYNLWFNGNNDTNIENIHQQKKTAALQMLINKCRRDKWSLRHASNLGVNGVCRRAFMLVAMEPRGQTIESLIELAVMRISPSDDKPRIYSLTTTDRLSAWSRARMLRLAETSDEADVLALHSEPFTGSARRIRYSLQLSLLRSGRESAQDQARNKKRATTLTAFANIERDTI